MLGYMNEEALRRTHESGRVTFWSRSRQALWTKGETSGNWLQLVEMRQDCDGDALLVRAEPAGPTCHTGHPSCFHRTLDGDTTAQRVPVATIMTQLVDLIAERHAHAQQPTPDVGNDAPSYTVKLLRGGVDRITKKIGEEATEVVIAAKNGAPDELTYEAADLLYHLLVLLENQHVALDDIYTELQRRHQS